MSADFGPTVLPRTEAKSCPFCGAQPTIEYWHGGKRSKRMVRCGNSGCHVAPSVTADTGKKALAIWNSRAPIVVTP